MELPKITIVTPSYNQGHFLEETIQSVLDQKYPNLEYFVVDGGSTDNSAEIIKKYEKHINWWVSEKDRGQPHALNKGFDRATGDVLGFINSDDCLLPGALNFVGKQFAQGVQWLVGWVLFVEPDDQNYPQLWHSYERPEHWFVTNPIGQQGTFWARALYQKHGGFREEYDMAFDYEYWMRLRFHAGLMPKVVRRCLGTYRMHASSKTMTQPSCEMQPEYERIRADCMKLLLREEQDQVTDFRQRRAMKRQCGAAWKALRDADLESARGLAKQTLRRAPFQWESWRLMLHALRGH